MIEVDESHSFQHPFVIFMKLANEMVKDTTLKMGVVDLRCWRFCVDAKFVQRYQEQTTFLHLPQPISHITCWYVEAVLVIIRTTS